MTNIITLEKTISLDNIKELINVSVSEDISYLRRNEGVSCNGCILIKGLYENNNGIEKNFKETIDVENIIPYENISSLDDFNMAVEDFEYALTDEDLKMYVKIKINSFKDIETSFPAEVFEEDIVVEERNEELVEEPIIEEEIVEEVKEELNEEREVVIPFLTDFLDNKKYQRSSTFFVYKNEITLEEICKKYNVSIEELKKNNKEEFKEGDLINIPLRHE